MLTTAIGIEELIEKVRRYNPDAQVELIRRAYDFSAQAHEGQLRRSGEPYLAHPLAVAEILTALRLDVPAIVAGLMHDTIEDTIRTRAQIEEGRSWIWRDDGTILFKAEASAWTPSAVQLQQVWVDPPVRNRRHAQRALRDLIRLLLERAPVVCLFVRPENAPAIRVYDGIGMRRTISYRSLVF